MCGSQTGGRAGDQHPCHGKSSELEQGLDGAAFVHGAVALGDLVEREGEVEHLPGVDLAVADEVDQLWQEAPDGSGAAVEVDAGEEQVDPGMATS